MQRNVTARQAEVTQVHTFFWLILDSFKNCLLAFPFDLKSLGFYLHFRRKNFSQLKFPTHIHFNYSRWVNEPLMVFANFYI